MAGQRIIGIVGEGAQSGKSTAAAQIAQSLGNSVNTPFAYTLKRMLKVLLMDLGMPEAEAEARLYGHLKEEPCELLGGKTVRDLMQTLGTEWGRNMVKQDLWLDCWKKRTEEVLSTGAHATVDDVRFMNEVDLIKMYGGLTFKVKGRSKEVTSATNQHSSENQGIPDEACDAVVENDSTIEKLRERIIKAVTSILPFN